MRLQVVNWSLTGLVLFLSGGRFAIRRISPGRWHWDDLAHLIALLILLAHGATNMLVLDVKDQLAASMSAAPTDESRVLALYQRLSYLDVVNDCLFFLCIWATKMAWLLLYYYLFRTSVNFRIAWWAVLGFVIVAFWAPVGGLIATCNWASSLSDYGKLSFLSAERETNRKEMLTHTRNSLLQHTQFLRPDPSDLYLCLGRHDRLRYHGPSPRHAV